MWRCGEDKRKPQQVKYQKPANKAEWMATGDKENRMTRNGREGWPLSLKIQETRGNEQILEETDLSRMQTEK